jgi:rRNA maturation endonuclease Nob1
MPSFFGELPMPFIYSTLSNDNVYVQYAEQKSNNLAPVAVGSIYIAGKANITNKNLLTPKGVVTEVTDAQLKDLELSEVFNIHVKNGFITVDKSKKDADKVAKDMTAKDKSAPLSEEDVPQVVDGSVKVAK